MMPLQASTTSYDSRIVSENSILKGLRYFFLGEKIPIQSSFDMSRGIPAAISILIIGELVSKYIFVQAKHDFVAYEISAVKVSMLANSLFWHKAVPAVIFYIFVIPLAILTYQSIAANALLRAGIFFVMFIYGLAQSLIGIAEAMQFKNLAFDLVVFKELRAHLLRNLQVGNTFDNRWLYEVFKQYFKALSRGEINLNEILKKIASTDSQSYRSLFYPLLCRTALFTSLRQLDHIKYICGSVTSTDQAALWLFSKIAIECIHRNSTEWTANPIRYREEINAARTCLTIIRTRKLFKDVCQIPMGVDFEKIQEMAATCGHSLPLILVLR